MRSLVLALLVLASSPPEAAAAAGPPRAGLALKIPPVETLLPAETAVPDALEDIARHNLSGRVPTRNGFVRSLPRPRPVRLSAADLLRPTPFALAGGVVTRSPAGALVWSGEVAVEGAHALRLHLGSVSLPAGTRAWVYAPGGESAAVPLALFHGRSDLWTGPVRGESLWLEVTVPGILEKDNHCFVTVPCAEKDFPATVAGIKEAVARIFFVKGESGFICSGGLLEDTDPNTDRPFFLTANHCIPDAQVASTAVSFFRLWNASCGSAQENPPDRVDGATLLATLVDTDGTLLELAGLPPNPRFLPFDADPAASAPGVDELPGLFDRGGFDP